MRAALLFAIAAGTGIAMTTPDATEIVKRSVANNEINWKAAAQYSFIERDVLATGDRKETKDYVVMMIDGAPYYKLIAVDQEPLAARAARQEEYKLQQEIRRRQGESARERRGRIARYQQERRQDHELMSEMVKAFDFQLTGEETLHGRRCYVLQATPRRGYQPRSHETKVLRAMRGRMWVDANAYQWVRVHAEVLQPVAFGLFIAHVEPGTEFTLDEAPIGGGLWMPSHFTTTVKSNVLLWSRNSVDDETYTGYRLGNGAAAISPGETGKPAR